MRGCLTLPFVLVGFAMIANAQGPSIPPSVAEFGNSPEGVYKALLFAMGTGDEAAIRAVTVATPGLGRLLETGRVPSEGVASLRERLLKGNDVIRLKVGDIVSMAGGETYVVKESDVVEGRALVKDGAAGTLPIRCRVENGRWRVDARLIIANRRVAGVVHMKGVAAQVHRSILMPSPLVGPPYPNTPEGACRTFFAAYLTADAPNLHAVALPRDGFDWLLKREPCSFDQAAKYQADLDKRTFRTLKVGDTIEVAGRKVTITAKEVGPARAVVAVEFPATLLTPCELINGHWWVDPRPLIAGLKADPGSKPKPALKP